MFCMLFWLVYCPRDGDVDRRSCLFCIYSARLDGRFPLILRHALGTIFLIYYSSLSHLVVRSVCLRRHACKQGKAHGSFNDPPLDSETHAFTCFFSPVILAPALPPTLENIFKEQLISLSPHLTKEWVSLSWMIGCMCRD